MYEAFKYLIPFIFSPDSKLYPTRQAFKADPSK